jgi:hypothetical protein
LVAYYWTGLVVVIVVVPVVHSFLYSSGSYLYYTEWSILGCQNWNWRICNFVSCLYSIAEHYFLSDPELRDTIPQDYLSHKEKYEQAVRKACTLFRKVTQLRDKGGDLEIFR